MTPRFAVQLQSKGRGTALHRRWYLGFAACVGSASTQSRGLKSRDNGVMNARAAVGGSETVSISGMSRQILRTEEVTALCA